MPKRQDQRLRAAKPENELAEQLDHPLYEMEMTLGAAKVVGVGTKQIFQKNLELEAFIIHARCLQEFFSSKANREGTMWATDFVTGFKAPGLNRVDLARMHREVAHLTYYRKKLGDRGGWVVDKVGAPIFEASLKFLKSLASRPLLAFSSNSKRVAALISEFESRAAHPPFSSFATGTSSTHTVVVTACMEPPSSSPPPSLDIYEVL